MTACPVPDTGSPRALIRGPILTTPRQPHDPLRTSPPHGRPQAQIRSRTRHHQTSPYRRSRRPRLDSVRSTGTVRGHPAHRPGRLSAAHLRPPSPASAAASTTPAAKAKSPTPNPSSSTCSPGPGTTATANCSAGTYRLGPPVPRYCRIKPISKRPYPNIPPGLSGRVAFAKLCLP